MVTPKAGFARAGAISGNVSNLTYDAENRLTAVSGATSASFTYDGDGNRVKPVLNGVTTYYVGNHFEWTGSTSVAGAPRRSEEGRADGLSSTGIHERRQCKIAKMRYHFPLLGCATSSPVS